MKTCSRCNIEKEDDQFRWRYDKRGKYSKACKYLNNTCKKCDAEISNRHYFKNKDDKEFIEKWRKRSRDYHAAHAEERRAKMKAKRETPEYKSYVKAYRERRKDIIRQQEIITKRRYHEKHRNAISDSYIIRQLVTQGFGTYDQVSKNTELMEYERAKILLHRLKQQLYVKTN